MKRQAFDRVETAKVPAPASVLAETDHPEWLHHRLTVSGPAAPIEAFRKQASGAAAIPWQIDFDAEEARLLAPMIAEGADARVLARSLRDAIASHHQRALAQSARGGVYPLDLHRLVPVPDDILILGPDDPKSRHWLWEHWGTLYPLRQVRVVDDTDRRLRKSAKITFDFYAADWTPWQALLRMRVDWPDLVFVMQPDYGSE